MPLRRPMPFALLALFTLMLWLALASVAHAAQMVSVKKQANMRSGAGTRHEALWLLDQGYPLQVLGRQGAWVKVKDFEGDVGWVFGRLTGPQRHFIVKVDRANVRRGPGLRQRILASVRYGDVLRTLETRKDWVKVRLSGGPVGWVSRRLLWGW